MTPYPQGRIPQIRSDRAAAAFEAAYERLAATLPDDHSESSLAEAENAAASLTDPFAPGFDGITEDRLDLRQVPFVTIDPPGATDLDQAVWIGEPDALRLPGVGDAAGGDDAGDRAPTETDPDTARWRVLYAIADVGRFVRPGGALDAETRERGLTVYLPHRKVPLHPPVLSEDAASLLPGRERAAYVFDVLLDSDGVIVRARVLRAVVTSTAQLDYAQVQEAADSGAPLHASIAALPEVGRALLTQQEARGGIDLAVPDQEVEETPDGYRLVLRPRRSVEDANAQISLLAGRVAAAFMLDAGHGILRTMPAPDPRTQDEFRKVVASLGFPATGSYQQILAAIDHTGEDPRALAVHYASPMLFRGAAYTVIAEPEPGTGAEARAGSAGTGAPRESGSPAGAGTREARGASAGESGYVQAAVGAPYAHTTAPLRRLVDRFVLPLAWAQSEAAEVPVFALEALDELPDLLRSAGSRESGIERAVIDMTEAFVLAGSVGAEFDAVVVSVRGGGENRPVRSEIHIAEPAVVAFVDGEREVGTRVRVRLEGVDTAEGTVTFAFLG